MTSSSSSGKQAPDNQQKGGRWRRFVPPFIKEEIKRSIREEVKRSLLDMQAENKVQEALDKFDIDEKLNTVVNRFTEETIRNKEKEINSKLDMTLQEIRIKQRMKLDDKVKEIKKTQIIK